MQGENLEAKNIDQVWEADRLGRRQDADFLYNFIVGEVAKRKRQNRRSSYALNVDARWGAGKSFFLERFGKQAELQGHVVAYVNAWQDDHASDPYVAIMAAIDRAFAPYVREDSGLKKAWTAVVENGGPIAMKIGAGVLRSIGKKHADITSDDLLSDDPDPSFATDLAEAVVESSLETGKAEIEKLFDRTLQKMIDQFKKADRAVKSFRKRLAEAVQILDQSGKKAPFFILIDELDRCRPSYAVHLLERIKHLFEVDGVAFIFATNSQQLQYSIIGTYGAGFDGFIYLKRFFDRTYIFKEVSVKRQIEELSASIEKRKVRVPLDDLVEFLSSACDAYELDLRAIEQILEMVDVAVSAWQHPIPLDMVILFPLCVSFYRTGTVDLVVAQRDIPKGWFIGDTVQDYRQTIDRRVMINQAFSVATDRFTSMEKVMSAQEANNDAPTERYVRQTFMPEWNGKFVDRNSRSIQADLIDLVANAGRLAVKSTAA
ncbi:hypothetical protein FHT87_004781 [Rhizobium sp. BK316]|uniref:KAP family P-loop NTPase fold protein n=1 Tax=Rhizobium sp. BK316 TaxID=2587053 RepID=UPI00161E1706|nr:P-loop NTPase fold protein [Rhizobium sp. BK316]MBB3410834.1 hypothetical protein [Rhizobium sp. BK316]